MLIAQDINYIVDQF